MSEEKKVIFSGVQPSGMLTLGNYLGALSNWVKLQDNESYDCIYCVVDLHAITVKQEPSKLRKQILETYAILMACGIDPNRSLLFMQSHVPAHAELAWILSCYTQFGELSRMTQFKDKSSRYAENINAGLFTYPSLMAADILLYGTHLVPVGGDQKQHLELSRDVANRFNGQYSETFVVPEPYIPEKAARIMSLQAPDKKMSKSDDAEGGYIALLDPKDVIIKKFKRAVTDLGSEICEREDKPGISNLMRIYSSVTNKTMEETAKEFEGRGYGDFKLAVGEVVADSLAPIRDRFDMLMANKDELQRLYIEGGQKAALRSRKMLSKVYKKIGFI